MVVLRNSRNEVTQTTGKFLEASKIMRLEVNKEKTKYMCISWNDGNNSDLIGRHIFIKKVSSYKYLGVNINENNVHEELQERIDSSNKCYYNSLKLIR